MPKLQWFHIYGHFFLTTCLLNKYYFHNRNIKQHILHMLQKNVTDPVMLATLPNYLANRKSSKRTYGAMVNPEDNHILSASYPYLNNLDGIEDNRDHYFLWMLGGTPLDWALERAICSGDLHIVKIILESCKRWPDFVLINYCSKTSLHSIIHAASEVAKQVKAFSIHLNNLVSELPKTVFKMEQLLTNEFEGSTVSGTDNKITLYEDEDMSATPVLKEAAAGDLDGLLDEAPAADAKLQATEDAALDDGVVAKDEESTETIVEKGGDEGAPKSGGSPGNPIVDNTSDTGAVSLDEGGVPEGFRKEERAVKSLEDGKLVEKTGLYYVNDAGDEIFAGWVEKASIEETAPVTDQYTPAEVKLFEAMGVMAKNIAGLIIKIDEQNERIEAVSKTADTAQETADSTVVLPSPADDLDNVIATLNGQQRVVKGAAPAATETEEVDIWKGVLPELQSDAA